MPVETGAIDVSFKYFGLEPTASLAAVKEAFRRYAKEFHPDKFPKDSDAQKMASEKMIAANSHFDDLKKFFEEYPDGKPAEEGQTSHEPQNDDDWESWEKQRRNAFDEELNAWKARQAAMEQGKERDREFLRRKKLVMYCRWGTVLVIIFMWMGWFSANGRLNREIGRQQATDNMLNQVTGNDELHQRWMRDHAEYRPDYQSKADQQPVNGLLLLLISAGAGWGLFSKKGREIVDNYLAAASK